MTEAVKEGEKFRETKGGGVWVFVLLSTCCLPEETVADIGSGTRVFPKSKLTLADRKEADLPTLSVRIQCISQWHKPKTLDADSSALSSSAVSHLFCSLAIISSLLPTGTVSHLGCGAEGLQVRSGQGGGRDRIEGRDTKACPCKGRHLTAMAEGSSVALSLCAASYQ